MPAGAGPGGGVVSCDAGDLPVSGSDWLETEGGCAAALFRPAFAAAMPMSHVMPDCIVDGPGWRELPVTYHMPATAAHRTAVSPSMIATLRPLPDSSVGDVTIFLDMERTGHRETIGL